MDPNFDASRPASPDPIDRFGGSFARARWQATEAANACVIATVGPDGAPSARVVLLKRFEAGGFEFFTNLLSRKAQELRANPRIALTFH